MCKEACKWQVRGRRRVAGNVGVLHAVAGPWGGVAWPQRSKERASAHVRGPSAGVQVVLAPADQAAIALGWEKGGITVRHSACRPGLTEALGRLDDTSGVAVVD